MQRTVVSQKGIGRLIIAAVVLVGVIEAIFRV